MFCQNGCWNSDEESSLSSFESSQPQPYSVASASSSSSNNNNNNNSHKKHYATESIDESDVALAKEMNALSVQEREKILEDIHGVAPVPTETPEFVTKCIHDVDVSLSMIPKAKRKALDRAIFLNPSILIDLKLKLMFLRAELYHARKAAQRIAKYYEEKLYYFGDGKLAKRLTLQDLSPEEGDLKNLNYRGCVVLPQKDPSGRPIWFFDIPRFDFEEPDSLARCFWYNVEASVMDDDIAQLKGVNGVAYCPDERLAVPASMPKVLKVLKRAGEEGQGFPSRQSAFQICYNDSRVKYISSSIGKILGKQVRLRMRTHFGSDQEMQYSLMTFGIKCDYLFRSAKEEERRKVQDDYIQRRREIERIQEEKRIQEELQSGIIQCPQPNDVLVGRGRPYQDFPGNHRLLALVDKHYDRYRQIIAAKRKEKTQFFLEIIQEIHDSNGRFLEREKISVAGWKVASEKVAREKTAGAFRFKTFQLANNNNNNNKEATANQPLSSPTAASEGEGGGEGCVDNKDTMPDSNTRSTKRVRYEKR